MHAIKVDPANQPRRPLNTPNGEIVLWRRVVRSSFIRGPGAGAECGLRFWRPVGAVGSVVGGTGQAVQSVFYGAGGIVGGIVGGVAGGVSALFGGPGYTYAAPAGRGTRSRRRSMRPAQSPGRPSRW